MHTSFSDWILVRDGNSKDAPIIGDKLCGSNIPQPVTASGSELYLEFHSDGSSTEKGFQLTVKEGLYQIINSNTNLTELLHNNNNITHPTLVLFVVFLIVLAVAIWSSWQAWGPCSVTVGAGQRQRKRVCIHESCCAPDIKNKPCYEFDVQDCVSKLHICYSQ